MTRWMLGFAVIALLGAGTGCRTTARYDQASAVILERTSEAGRERYTIQSGGKLLVSRELRKPRGHLGVASQTLSLERAHQLGIDPFEGVYVEAVENDSPAERAGLLPGDVILEIHGKAIHSRDQFRYLTANAALEEPLQLLVRRAGENRVLDAHLEQRFEDEDIKSLIRLESQSDARMVGLELSTIPEDMVREIWEAEGSARAIVSNVVTGGPGYFAGLRAGDVIHSCNGKVIATADEFFAEIRRAGEGETVEVVLKNAGNTEPMLLEIDDDFQGGAWFGIPLLVGYESDHRHTDFGLLLGGLLVNYESEYSPTSKREPSSRSEFGLVLDLFEVETDDDSTCISFLWFINLRFD